jgi:creatinine amidohydrolase
VLAYLDLSGPTVRALERLVETQQEGTHAEEIETSIMLAIDETAVDMRKAAVEYMAAKGGSRGPFSLDPKSPLYNPSGIYGDATRATAAKGRFINDGMTRIILEEIEQLRHAVVPANTLSGGAPAPSPAASRPAP